MTNEQQYAELKENFDHFDSDGNGAIDFGEFRDLMDALDAGLTETEARAGFDAIDTDASGRIEFVEFCGWWTGR